MSQPLSHKTEAGNPGGAPIYLVDDEPMLLELASVILAPLGYPIKTFRNPEAALKAFASAQPPPALVITDFAMHGMNGLELIEACRRICPEQKTLVLSGTVGADFFFDAPTKPNRYLAKPYQAKQLIEVVRSMLTS
jgi:CheY-like chemotaxis protein